MNGDTFADLVTANTNANNVSILLGNGDGAFQAQVTNAVGYSPSSVAVADLNGDPFVDILTANRESDTVSLLIAR